MRHIEMPSIKEQVREMENRMTTRNSNGNSRKRKEEIIFKEKIDEEVI